MAILPILVLIYIDDNLIAINAYIHDNNCNCVHYGYCHVYVHTTITITTCIMVIAMYICINCNQIVINTYIHGNNCYITWLHTHVSLRCFFIAVLLL